MQGKLFNRALYLENDSIAKQAGIYHLANNGAKWITINPKKYDCDILYRYSHDQDTPPSLLEVEVKKTWKGGQFPFETVNVLERKSKYFELGADLLLLSANLKDYLIIKGSDILAIEPTEVQNKYVHQLEFFYQVPLSLVEFYRFSRPLKPDYSMACRCGNEAYFANDLHLTCDVCGRKK